jgi:hypothetical protein
VLGARVRKQIIVSVPAGERLFKEERTHVTAILVVGSRLRWQATMNGTINRYDFQSVDMLWLGKNQFLPVCLAGVKEVSSAVFRYQPGECARCAARRVELPLCNDPPFSAQVRPLKHTP